MYIIWCGTHLANETTGEGVKLVTITTIGLMVHKNTAQHQPTYR